jgi:hypothetical protein
MTTMDAIKRTSGPQTTNGRRWEMPLSGVPTREWLALFKASGDPTAKAAPQRVEFDLASVAFRSDEDQVEHWVASIDTWIASTNERYQMSLEQARRERSDLGDAASRERERIRQLNDRFKDL